MIQLSAREESYTYDLFHITKAFFPQEEIVQKLEEDLPMLIHVQIDGETVLEISAQEVEAYETKHDRKQYVNHHLYDALADRTGHGLSWGILTGVRPTKLMMKALEEGKSDAEISSWLRTQYRVSEEKIRLGIEVAKKERSLLSQLDYQDGYSLYVGIPFCPTTCAYCSFTSYPIRKWSDRVDEYLDAVCRELSFIGESSGDKKLNTIYIGGGTPTTLTEEQMDRLLTHLEQTFSYDDLKEITVEAGRPDSITRGKLQVLKEHAIQRISINPQTMQQRTLDLIGRHHTVEQIIETYHMARNLGFDNINMDLIAGLPGETREDMAHTLAEIKKLAPDSLTVHSLAIKRASRMGQEQDLWRTEEKIQARELEAMIEEARSCAQEMGLLPYYMYRQKNIAGNFENVGYAKVDKAGIYNILIMEEKQSILAVGAGASTKFVRGQDAEKKIVRTENVKSVDEYIARIDEMIERKGEWLWR